MRVFFKTMFIAASASVIAGCAAIGDTGKIFHVRETAYLESHETPPLVIPPDLSSSKFQPQYEIPPGPGEVVVPPLPIPPGMTPVYKIKKTITPTPKFKESK